MKLAAISTSPKVSPPKNFLSFISSSSIFRASKASSTAFSRPFSSLQQAFHIAGKI